jgi:hypothetical protein
MGIHFKIDVALIKINKIKPHQYLYNCYNV